MYFRKNKTGTYIILLLLASWLPLEASEACNDYPYVYEVGDSLYTTASSGLRVRKTPGLDGEKVALLPLNSKVDVIGVIPEVEKLGEIASCWFNVSFSLIPEKAQTGWVFGGYLQKFRGYGIEAENKVLKNEKYIIRNGPLLKFYDNENNLKLSLLDRNDEARVYESSLHVDFRVLQILDDGVAILSKAYSKPESGCCGSSFILVDRSTGKHTKSAREFTFGGILLVSPKQNYIFAGRLGSDYRGGGIVFMLQRSGIQLTPVFEDDGTINETTINGAIESSEWLSNEKLSVVISVYHYDGEEKTVQLLLSQRADGTWYHELTEP